MGWKQVLESFRTEATAFAVHRDGYEISGRTLGEGRPLYLLPGIGGTHELYCLLAWLLKADFRLVLIDYPGSPGQAARPQRLSAESLAGDLFAVADHHDDPEFDLYATSFGTVVALSAILSQPDRIGHAVLQGGFARRKLSLTERALLGMLRWMPGNAPRIPGRSLIQTLNHRPWFPALDPTRYEFLVENTGQVAIRTLAQRATLLRTLDLRPSLREITTPLILVRCEGEGLVAESCHRELALGLPHARVEYFAGCGHLPYLTHPHRVATLLREFLFPSPEGSADACCSDPHCSE